MAVRSTALALICLYVTGPMEACYNSLIFIDSPLVSSRFCQNGASVADPTTFEELLQSRHLYRSNRLRVIFCPQVNLASLIRTSKDRGHLRVASAQQSARVSTRWPDPIHMRPSVNL